MAAPAPTADPSLSLAVPPNYEIPPQVRSALADIKARGKKVVVMTCGISGSGKSTLARTLASQLAFTRLSIDQSVHRRHGVYGVDYAPSQHPSLQDAAETSLLADLKMLLADDSRDIVLDLSFWSREWRDEYRAVVEGWGGDRYGVLLVVFRVQGSEEVQERVLWGRIEERRGERERRVERGWRGEEGMSVGREVLRGYVRGMEWPVGEGEVVVDVV